MKIKQLHSVWHILRQKLVSFDDNSYSHFYVSRKKLMSESSGYLPKEKSEKSWHEARFSSSISCALLKGTGKPTVNVIHPFSKHLSGTYHASDVWRELEAQSQPGLSPSLKKPVA